VSTKTDWPYDADRDDPLTALRIPVTGSHPNRWYLIAFDRDSEARPTDDEAAMLVSYLDYTRAWYREYWQEKMLAEPLDHDAGHNTVIFHKWADGDWGYRRATHEIGPLFFPGAPWMRERKAGPFTLAGLLDWIDGGGMEPSKRWTEWKANHPDIFG
jgi:hypothetical protein